MKKSFQDFIRKELPDSFLMITTGLPGMGKTKAAEEVVKIKNCLMLRSDTIRLEVMKGQDIFDEKVAGNINQRLAVYAELFKRAVEALKKRDCVILDATFITLALRSRAAEIAVKYHKPLVILDTECPKDVALARINRRSIENYESNAVTEQAYLDNASKFEPVDISAMKNAYPSLTIIHVKVDTSVGENDCIFITNIEKK